MIDGISHTEEAHPWVSFFLGVLGVSTFLMVPATFVTILVTMENSDKWVSIAEHDFNFDSQLIIHWLMRFTHIIGVGIVFGVAYQYFFTTGSHDYRKHSLMRWIIGGTRCSLMSAATLYQARGI